MLPLSAEPVRVPRRRWDGGLRDSLVADTMQKLEATLFLIYPSGPRSASSILEEQTNDRIQQMVRASFAYRTSILLNKMGRCARKQ